MKSLKGKLILIILTLITISSLLTISIGLFQSFNVTDKIINTLVEDRLTSSNNMLKTYLDEQFGSLSLNSNGELIDKNNQTIDGNFQYIDKFSQDMDTVATVFAKDGNKYIRVLTTIKDDKGERVVGTELDTNGQAYKEISNGKDYFGEANILGSKYMTGYTPIYDSNKQIIGIYFVGVPIESVNSILNEGMVLTVRPVVLLTVFILIIAAIITYFVSNGIAKPIKKVATVAQQIADGNFDVELSVNSKDEVGQLAKAFNLTIERLINYQGYIDEISETLLSVSNGDLTVTAKREYVGQFKKLKDNMQAMLTNLNSTLLQINESAAQVDSGAEQVASGAQALSQGTTEQASSIEELASTVNTITEQIKETAENAERAKQIANESGVATEQSQEQMKLMIEAMEEISSASNEIGKIIKNIDDIAFQTNILALNAAVEAARAGAAGKGFAVVAEEVRNLASKSAESAKSTAELIESSLDAIEKGSNIVSDTAKSLEEVVSGSKKSAEVIQDIADASIEQSQAISQVNIGIGQISDVVQTNSATAEESAAASEELSGQAQMLKDLISKFKLKPDNSSSSSSYEKYSQTHSYSEEMNEKSAKFTPTTYIDL